VALKVQQSNQPS